MISMLKHDPLAHVLLVTTPGSSVSRVPLGSRTADAGSDATVAARTTDDKKNFFADLLIFMNSLLAIFDEFELIDPLFLHAV
jgi:hypothetical protein